MSDNSDFLCIYFFSAAQIIHHCFRICGKILIGSCCVSTLWSGSTPVITSKHSNSVSGQIIGDDKERFVSHDFLIPVLRTASCHHYHCRKFSSFFGKSQCSGKVNSIPFIPHGDFFTSVRERRLRLLWTFGAAGFSLFQIQRKGHPLRKCSVDCVITVQFSFVRSMNHRYLDN